MSIDLFNSTYIGWMGRARIGDSDKQSGAISSQSPVSSLSPPINNATGKLCWQSKEAWQKAP